MGKDTLLEAQLVNYDLTRKIFAVKTMDTLTRLIEREAGEEDPDLFAIAAMSSSMASLLSALS